MAKQSSSTKRRRARRAVPSRSGPTPKRTARRVRRLLALQRQSSRNKKIAAGVRRYVQQVRDVQAREGIAFRSAQAVVRQRREAGRPLLARPEAIFEAREGTEEFGFNVEDVIRRVHPSVLEKLNVTHYRITAVGYPIAGQFETRSVGEPIVRELFVIAREATPEAFFRAYFDALREFRDWLKASFPGIPYWIINVRGIYYA